MKAEDYATDLVFTVTPVTPVIFAQTLARRADISSCPCNKRNFQPNRNP